MAGRVRGRRGDRRGVAGHDWAATPLGPIDAWPQSLRTAVTICLHSRFPILLWWGDELVMLYNDAYRPILGRIEAARWARGPPRCWPEIWDIIGPMLDGVLRRAGRHLVRGPAAAARAPRLRRGVLLHLLVQPDPRRVRRAGGVFTAVTETTGRVLSDRRLRLLSTLAAGLVDATGPEEVGRRAVEALAGSPAVPFVRLDLADRGRPAAGHRHRGRRPGRRRGVLAAGQGLEGGEPWLLPLDPADDPDRPGTPMVAAWCRCRSPVAAPTAALVVGSTRAARSTRTTAPSWSCWPGTSAPRSPAPGRTRRSTAGRRRWPNWTRRSQPSSPTSVTSCAPR